MHHTNVMNDISSFCNVSTSHGYDLLPYIQRRTEFGPSRNPGIDLGLTLRCSPKRFAKAMDVFQQARNLPKRLTKEGLIKPRHSGAFRSILFHILIFMGVDHHKCYDGSYSRAWIYRARIFQNIGNTEHTIILLKFLRKSIIKSHSIQNCNSAGRLIYTNAHCALVSDASTGSLRSLSMHSDR